MMSDRQTENSDNTGTFKTNAVSTDISPVKKIKRSLLDQEIL